MLGASRINHEESNSCNILQRMCQQIDQQVQMLLNNLSTEDLSHLNNKIIDKCINSTKSAILRILGLKLPQVAAIQQKYKRIIIEINQDMESHKAKWKQLSLKYEQLVLENDRFKMQTVHFNQLYQWQKLQKIELVKKLEEAVRNLEKEHLIKADKQYKQENEVKRLEQLEEFRKRQRLSNQRILDLVEQKKRLQDAIQQNQELIKLLKQEISTTILQNESTKQTIEQLTKQNEQIVMKHREQLKIKQNEIQRINFERQKEIKQKQEKIRQSQDALRLKNSCIMGKDEQIVKNQENYRKLSALFEDKDKLVGQLKQKTKELESTIAELNKKCEKIGSIQKIQQTLQHKYTQKISILNKYTKQQSQKLKYYKKQNDRLYEGMEHFANKQVKLLNQVQSLQSKAKSMSQKITIFNKDRLNIKATLFKMKVQIANLRKMLSQQLEGNVKNLIKNYNCYLHEFSSLFSQKIIKKIQQNNLKWQTQNEELLSRTQKINIQLKVLQQRSLQSEMNANRVANALVESNKDINNSIAVKDEQIRSLQKQLKRQKQFNEDSVKKLAAVMKKYQLKNDFGSNSQNIESDLFIERKIANHRLKLLGLQNEFKALSQK